MGIFKILPCGDSAVTVQFGEIADIDTNTKVRAFEMTLKKRCVHGITETIPTYRSVMVHYDPLVLRYDALCSLLDDLSYTVDWHSISPGNEVVRIPVLYNVAGSEIETVAAYEGKSIDEIIRIHSQSEHYVFMLGFTPGNAYIGCPGGSFTIPRKASPTMRPFSRAVTIWSDQTNIGAFSGPTGWYTIGRTPVRPYDPRHEEPILFKPGQWVQFYAIDQAQYEEIERDVERLIYQPEIVCRKPR